MGLLEVNGLSKSFGGVKALNGISFTVQEGEILGLIGPNGAGKTTCFNLVTGFDQPSAGSVVFDGVDVTGLPAYRLARLGIIRTFQHTSVFPNLTVNENVLTGTLRLTPRNAWNAIFNTRAFQDVEKEIKNRVEEILNVCYLTAQANQLAGTLPYGEQRRLEVAIAMAAMPRLLLVDEPAAGLNHSESNQMVEMLRQIRDRKVTIVLVEHDMRVVMNLCDRIVVLNQGTKVTEGAPEEVRSNEEVIRIYLGRSGNVSVSVTGQ